MSEYADPTIQVIVTGEGGWTVYFMDGEKKIPADQIFMSARDFWYYYIVGNEIAADDE